MSKFGYTVSETGFINGYAFKDQSVLDTHCEAFETVKHIDRDTVVLSTWSKYGSRGYTIDVNAVKGLEPLQVLVLVNGGAVPFGGTVRGSKVTVYTD